MTNNVPVLVVEDESDSVFLLERAFRKAEVPNPIRAVPSVTAAIEYLTWATEPDRKAQHPLPALILLDIKLPRKGGLEMLKWVRAHGSLHSLIVVVFTSSTARDDVLNAYRAGANSYLVKPSSLDELTEVARDISDYWLRRNQPPIPGY